ncbi:MAG: hypothetical protein ACLQIB_51965 [Isosphaeraceae bacterium]
MMNYRRVFLLPAILVLASPAFGQHTGGRGVTHPGAAGHPGEFQPGQGMPHHMMTPEMQYQHMMQQFWLEQMMLNEMYSMPRPRRGHSQLHSGAGQLHSGAYQTGPERGQGSMARQPRAKPQTQAHNDGSGQRQVDPTSGKKADQAEGTSTGRHHHQNRPVGKTHPREATPVNQRRPGADQATIGLLRTVHSRLHKADADYQGHRVRAMEHIAAALRHLGATSPGAVSLSLAVGAGNLPQRRSDEILREAIHTLSRTELMVGTGAHNAAHHQSARSSVAAAIRELNIALSIR